MQKHLKFFGLIVFSTFIQNSEFPALQNIKQITFCSMGFEKAGEAYFNSDASKIIFQAVPHGKKHYQIYVLDISSKKAQMVSTGKGACTCAYFRPDDKKIIFASSHEDPGVGAEDLEAPGYQRENKNYSWKFTPYMNVYEADPDGSNLKALTFGPAYKAECAYSSDGLQIVFASNADGNMNLYIMNSDGTGMRQVTKDKNVYNGGPFFSPDNKRIIYRSDPDKKDYLQIYSMHVDGTDKQQITINGAVNWAPYWHPNGKVIAFTTSLHGHANYQIYLLNIITNKTFRLTHGSSFDGLPTFSKDGKKILWTSKRGGDGNCQIFMADFILPGCLK